MASKMLQQYLAAEHLVDRLKGSAARSAPAHNQACGRDPEIDADA
jgi:hypothetical protein